MYTDSQFIRYKYARAVAKFMVASWRDIDVSNVVYGNGIYDEYHIRITQQPHCRSKV